MLNESAFLERAVKCFQIATDTRIVLDSTDRFKLILQIDWAIVLVVPQALLQKNIFVNILGTIGQIVSLEKKTVSGETKIRIVFGISWREIYVLITSSKCNTYSSLLCWSILCLPLVYKKKVKLVRMWYAHTEGRKYKHIPKHVLRAYLYAIVIFITAEQFRPVITAFYVFSQHCAWFLRRNGSRARFPKSHESRYHISCRSSFCSRYQARSNKIAKESPGLSAARSLKETVVCAFSGCSQRCSCQDCWGMY